MARGGAREGKWRGNWRMEWAASTLHTTSEHGVSSITTADVHTSAASSRLNWCPRRFKWTRPFRQKTKFWFLRVCHHVSNAVYELLYWTCGLKSCLCYSLQRVWGEVWYVRLKQNLTCCMLLGDSPASEFYMPTFRDTLLHLHRQVHAPSTYLPVKMEQSVPKRRHIKFRRREIAQKKAYNIQDTAKVWNQEFNLLPVCKDKKTRLCCLCLVTIHCDFWIIWPSSKHVQCTLCIWGHIKAVLVNLRQWPRMMTSDI